MDHRILFSQVREDPMVEIRAIQEHLDHLEDLNIMMVTSGGCNTLSVLSEIPNIKNLDSVDINIEQQHLAELKHAICIVYDTEDTLDIIEGRIEDPTAVLLNCHKYLSGPTYSYWSVRTHLIKEGINKIGAFEKLFVELVKSGMDFDKVFERQKLINIFGPDAVNYSMNREFSDHFRNVFEHYKNPHNNYFHQQILTGEYNLGQLPKLTEVSKVMTPVEQGHLPPYLTNEVSPFKVLTSPINYINKTVIQHIKDTKKNTYHVISVSNVTDWLSPTGVRLLCKHVKRVLKKGGIAIFRRLNSDVGLLKEVRKVFPNSKCVIDKSHFYSEVVLSQCTSA